MTINVLHLTSTPRGVGGVEQLLLDGAQCFGGRRVSVSFANVFANDDTGPFPVAMRRLGVPFRNISGSGPASIPVVLAQLVRLLQAWRTDVLHMHMFHATVAGTVAARMARVPVSVVTRHYLEAGYAHRSRVAQWLDSAAVRSATHVVGVSQAVRADLIERVGVGAERVTVIPNGINISRLNGDRSARARQAGPSSECVLCTVGSLVPWKGHADLIRAFGLAVQRVPALRLVLVGDGPERRALEQLAGDLGVGERVTFAGFTTDVPGILRACDVYVHAARDEALGVAILEAMAAGKPVVATAVGGVRDIISSETVGLLVPPANPHAMADAIVRLAGDPAERDRLGHRGERHVTESFSIEGVVARYESLYERLMNENQAAHVRARAHA
ncbi:MAG TPA: glycosyltransferase [Gemmatimonadaceae bacterium]